MAQQHQRVVALIDMDCFYCAVERYLDPSLLGLPMAVIQYNPYENGQNAGRSAELVGGVSSLAAQPAAARVAVRQGKVLLPGAVNGSIIAVSYEARKRGVTRFFRGREALKQCPDIVLVQVPTAHGKSDMTIYRQCGSRSLKIIREVCGADALVEKASVDEMYIDVSLPARALLTRTASHAAIFEEALCAGTHVAGATEAEDEAGRGAQPTGVLARNSFRAGHAGQVERAVDGASAAWWRREAAAWTDDEALLAAGAVLVARARHEVTRRLGFTCSAGVSANKLLAKLCGGLHKPNQQTVLPRSATHALLDPLPVDRLRGFGGKLGELLRAGRPDLGLAGFNTAGALRQAGPAVVARVLRGEWNHPEEQAAAACRMAAGEDLSAVEGRALPKQVGSSKNFGGLRGSARGPIDTREVLERWVSELAGDIAERLLEEAEENSRAPTALVAACRFEDDGFAWQSARSKRTPLRESAAGREATQGTITHETLVREALGLFGQLSLGRPPTRLAFNLLAMTVEGFVPIGAAAADGQGGALKRLFATASAQAASSTAASSTAAAAAATTAAGEGEGSYGNSRRGGVAAAGAAKRTRLDSAATALPDSDIQNVAVNTTVANCGNGTVIWQPGPQIVQSCSSQLPSQPPSRQQSHPPSLQGSPIAHNRQPQQLDVPSASPQVGTALADEEWACGACTLLNAPDARRCNVCDALRGSSLPAAATLAAQRGGSNPNRSRANSGSNKSNGKGQTGIVHFLRPNGNS